MKTRGRESAASLEIAHLAKVSATQRPDAPYDLTDEQADEWRAVVSRMPADWFPRETHSVLAQYCRHVVVARRISQLVQQCEKAKGFDLEDYSRLLGMQERESRTIASLATRMRLTQQSLYDAKKQRGPVIHGVKPWEDHCGYGPIR